MRSIILLTTVVLALVSSVPALAAATSDPTTYPLSKCIVSSETLGDHGDVVTREVNGREIRLCCKSCVKDLERDQAKYLEALDAAIVAAQLPDYPMENCVVSGEPLGGEMGDPINHLVGNRLVRLCCNMCKKDLAADPTTFISKLDEAVAAAQVESYPASTCPISGQPLGSMGDPYKYVFAGKLVQFCCGGCVGRFKENPIGALATIYGDADEPNNGYDELDHSGHKH